MRRCLFWVQHLLGTGHLKRAATAGRAPLVERGLEVTLASGGPAAALAGPGRRRAGPAAAVRAATSPSRRWSSAATARSTTRCGPSGARGCWLCSRPERAQVVVTEMFPFGRRAFRFELLPLLDARAERAPAAAGGRLGPRRPGQQGRTPSATPGCAIWRCARYDRVLVHGDPALIPFGLTFPHADALGRRLRPHRLRASSPDPIAQPPAIEVLVIGRRRRGRQSAARRRPSRRAPLSRSASAPGGWSPAASRARRAWIGCRAELPPGVRARAPPRRFPGADGAAAVSRSRRPATTPWSEGSGSASADGAGAVRRRLARTSRRIRAQRLAELGLAETAWRRRSDAEQPGRGDRPVAGSRRRGGRRSTSTARAIRPVDRARWPCAARLRSRRMQLARARGALDACAARGAASACGGGTTMPAATIRARAPARARRAARGLPLALAVVPDWLEPPARALIAAAPRPTVLQHGIAHADHAAGRASRRSSSAARARRDGCAEPGRGSGSAGSTRFGDAFLRGPGAALEPHRAAAVAERLPACGFAASRPSAGGRGRAGAGAAPGQHPSRPDRLARRRRCFAGRAMAPSGWRAAASADRDEPIGILSHHLAMDDARPSARSTGFWRWCRSSRELRSPGGELFGEGRMTAPLLAIRDLRSRSRADEGVVEAVQRRVVRRPAEPDGGAGRRERLRQDRDLAGDPGHPAGQRPDHRRLDLLQRPATRPARPSTSPRSPQDEPDAPRDPRRRGSRSSSRSR